MPVRLENNRNGRVIEYELPEEIDPPGATYPDRDSRAQARWEANKRKRLLDTLRRSRRWSTTQREVTRLSQVQLEHERREGERRRIAAELRAEFQQRLEDERALAARQAQAENETPDGDAPPAGKQPSQAELRRWAKEQGYEIPPRGKIPDDVVAAYRDAHQGA